MDPKYLIGVPEMDAQHEKLLELTAKLKTAENDEFAMNDLIMELIGYANAHLDQEEEFLKNKGLIDFEKEHAKKHVAFRDKAMEFYDMFRDADTIEAKSALMQKIGTFCENWLLQHIHVEDRAYAELLRKGRAS